MIQHQRNRVCEKKLKTAEAKVLKILNKIDTLKLSSDNISRLSIHRKSKIILSDHKKKIGVVLAIFFFGACYWIYEEFSSSRCALELPSWHRAAFRPAAECSACAEVRSVARLTNTTARLFEEYAYSATPVIVTDAVADWRAAKEFDFKFFAQFYKNGKMGKQTNDCFFFPYKSGLSSLKEVFSMDEQRANLSDGAPWYVGWSTCYDEETRKLRQYYSRPYFIPETAESDMVDWIFMGGPGQGAHMHVDSVRHMSWQAQLRGRKRWVLAPPPECLYHCSWMEFTVQPGEILVVDTNRWYHKTDVLPGDISITIGAEYD